MLDVGCSLETIVDIEWRSPEPPAQRRSSERKHKNSRLIIMDLLTPPRRLINKSYCRKKDCDTSQENNERLSVRATAGGAGAAMAFGLSERKCFKIKVSFVKAISLYVIGVGR
ncbi:hypothetical protein EVAR_90210_1 [Eumeta japonica]|uniref:Uncharacterized protein n=1 Tax=Eumeta variegata TaxID=151549 RepID=A0A4C1WUT7_EUMVA|nr:hypothetical protein EVAR_90210_1 [Eumeta japonica]